MKSVHNVRFNTLYEEHFSTVIRVAYRITGNRAAAEDLCQDSFVRLFEKMDRVPEGPESLYYLIRIVKNLSLNYEKRRVRERRAYSKIETHPAGEASEVLLKKETITGVQKALLDIPYKFRFPLILRVYEELSYREIAGVMKISEANVKVRIFRARKMIENHMKEDELYVPR